MDDQQNLEIAQSCKSLTEKIGEILPAVNSAAQSAKQACSTAADIVERVSVTVAPPLASGAANRTLAPPADVAQPSSFVRESSKAITDRDAAQAALPAVDAEVLPSPSPATSFENSRQLTSSSVATGNQGVANSSASSPNARQVPPSVYADMRRAMSEVSATGQQPDPVVEAAVAQRVDNLKKVLEEGLKRETKPHKTFTPNIGLKFVDKDPEKGFEPGEIDDKRAIDKMARDWGYEPRWRNGELSLRRFAAQEKRELAAEFAKQDLDDIQNKRRAPKGRLPAEKLSQFAKQSITKPEEVDDYLESHKGDPDPAVRARVYEAAKKLNDERKERPWTSKDRERAAKRISEGKADPDLIAQWEKDEQRQSGSDRGDEQWEDEQDEGSGWGAAKLFTRIPYYLQRIRRGYTKNLGRDIGRDMEGAGFSKETVAKIGTGAEWAGKTLGPTLGAFAAGGAARWATQFGFDQIQHGQVGQAVGSLGSVAGGETNAGIVGGMVQSSTSVVSGAVGGATTGAMLGGAPGAIIGGIAGASLEIAKLPERVNEWSKALVESKRGIAQWNGALTQYFAEAEWRQIRRDIASGREIGEPISRLGHAWQNLQDETRPTKDWVTGVLANALTNATRTVESGHTLATDPRRWWSGGAPNTEAGKATKAELEKLREEIGIKPPNVSSPWLRQLSPFSVLDGPSKATPDKESRERLIKATNDQIAKMDELLKALSRAPGLTQDQGKALEAERALIQKEMGTRGLKEKTDRTNVQEWASYWRAEPMKSNYVPRRR